MNWEGRAENWLWSVSRLYSLVMRNMYFKKSQHDLVFGVFIIQADDMFRPLFPGHPQVTRYITFEEAIQCRSYMI